MIGTTETWQQTFVYDSYGNRNCDTTNNNTTTILPGCPVNVCNPTVNPANNRLNDYYVDNTGNTTTDAENRAFIYDAENKQIEARDKRNNVVGQYVHDGDGKRVKKIVPSGETVSFVYDAAGKLVAEYANQISQAPQVRYLTRDHLGSPRMNTDADGNVTVRHDYHPFGEEIVGTGGRTIGQGYGSDDGVRKKFAAYERDTESDLDFAQARYFDFGFGRFSSPGPLYYTASRPADPQQFNLYVYVRNNPLKIIDPSGNDARAISNGAALTEKDRLALEKELKRIAPGTKVNADGSIKKAGFWQRVANRLTGHGVGQELISGLVNANRTTSINVLRSGDSETGTNDWSAATDGTGADAAVDWNVNQQSGGAMERTAKDAYTANGEVSEDSPPDRAIVLGHELIHALHIVGGTASLDSTASHDFVASASGVSDIYRETDLKYPTREDFRTVGFHPYAGRREVTENRLRRELKQPLRVAFLPIGNWNCISCGP